MKKEHISGSELARLVGVSRQAVTAAERAGRVHKDPVTKKYDPGHQLNSAFITMKRAESGIDNKRLVDTPPDQVPDSLAELYEAKLKAEVRKVRSMATKGELEIARLKKDLIPAELVTILMGHIKAGIQNHFLTLGQRVARGDVALRNRIDDAVSEAIKRTLTGAEEGLRRDAAPIIARMKEREASS